MNDIQVIDNNAPQPKKRGRKPGKTTKRKGYFYEKEEEAFIKYINSTDQTERDIIFREKLYPAFTKMIESIIRSYELFIPTEEFDETFCDTMSFLITKVNNFNTTKGRVIIDDKEYIITDKSMNFKDEFEPESYPIINNQIIMGEKVFDIIDDGLQFNNKIYPIKKFKVYSYCGTVCKNYLILKKTQYKKKRDRNIPYDVMFPTVDKDNRIDDDEAKNVTSFYNELISETISEIQKMLSVENIDKLTENEQNIGKALLEMLMNWEEIFERLENKKFNKTSVWFFLKERTNLDSKSIRDGLRKYKNLYFFTKEKMINE